MKSQEDFFPGIVRHSLSIFLVSWQVSLFGSRAAAFWGVSPLLQPLFNLQRTVLCEAYTGWSPVWCLLHWKEPPECSILVDSSQRIKIYKAMTLTLPSVLQIYLKETNQQGPFWSSKTLSRLNLYQCHILEHLGSLARAILCSGQDDRGWARYAQWWLLNEWIGMFQIEAVMAWRSRLN